MTRPVSTARVFATALTFGAAAALVATAALLPHQWGRLPAWWHVAMLLVAVGCLVALVHAALGRRSPVGPARVMVAAVAVGMASLPVVASGSWTQPDSPWICVFMPTALVACGLTFRAWPAALAIGLALLALDTAVRTTDVFAVSGLDVLGQGVYDLTLLLVALGILLALSFTEHELAAQGAGAADSYVRARTIEELSRHEAHWDALIHDELLGCLEVAATHGTSPEEVRRTAQAAVKHLRDGPAAPATTRERLRDGLLQAVLDTNPAATTRFSPATPDACAVPDEVAQALITAAAEALRNAAAHAYPGAVRGPVVVEMQHTEAGVHVIVSDDGDGFHRDRVPATSFGIPISIEDRMAAVGGRGLVSSMPGDGTRVHLSWAPRGTTR